MQIGLKVDVDTFRGTRQGVLPLARALVKKNIRATFYFSVGPDNMGRHLWRLLKPAFLVKMLRSKAASLYGWDIILRGTFWPGPLIGRICAPAIREVAAMGHEVGLHAWDHHAWQARLERGGREFALAQLRQGGECLAEILGRWPASSAAPGWKCDETTLAAKQEMPFVFNSDGRGTSIFRPLVNGAPSFQPQIPTTLPTYDEVIGRDGITHANYNEYLMGKLQPSALNVLTIHAEAEGCACLPLFEDFVARIQAQGAGFCPLSKLLPEDFKAIPAARLAPKVFPGREGWIAVQES